MKAVASVLFTAVLAILASPAPTAAAQDVGIWVYSNGNDSCGEWTANRRTSPESGKAAIELSWVLGWLTGADGEIEGFRHGMRFKHADNEAIAGWLDNYCRAHPLNVLFQAALSLNKQLALK